MRWRLALSLGVIAALAVAVWAALSSGDEEPPATTTASTATPATVTTLPSTTTTAPTSTVTTLATTSSTAAPDTTVSPEARLEEVRLILEDLYYRWFDAIYRNDEEAVREVIATEDRLEAFQEMAANHSYPSAPDPAQIRTKDVEILEDSPDCLVVHSTLDLTEWLGEGMTSSGVDVLWPHTDGWRRATLWAHPQDLWRTDCEAERTDELP